MATYIFSPYEIIDFEVVCEAVVYVQFIKHKNWLKLFFQDITDL